MAKQNFSYYVKRDKNKNVLELTRNLSQNLKKITINIKNIKAKAGSLEEF